MARLDDEARAATMLHTLYPDLVARRDPESGLAGRAYKAVSRNDDAAQMQARALAERSETAVGRAVTAILAAACGDGDFAAAIDAVKAVYR